MMRYLLVVFSLVVTFQLSAVIINIPADQPTIQAGLDIAAQGDTVLVSEGIYYENILWPSANGIRLIGMDRDACIIDGSNQDQVISYENWDVVHDSTNVIKNFTIRHGYSVRGAGINLRSPNQFILENLIVKDNYLYFLNDEDKSDNEYHIEGGAGIHLDNESSPIIRNVRISNNFAENNGGGLFVYMASEPILQNVLIADNISTQSGGGIFLEAGCNLDLTNVTIANNHAQQHGGGIYIDGMSFSDVWITNSILWNNLSEEIYVNAMAPVNMTISVSYTDLQGGENGIVINGFPTIVNWLDGNIDQDPLFADPLNGDYQLTANSPCIDAGDPASPLDPDGTIADMGAYYYDQSVIIDDQKIPVTKYSLSNYPNPFNPSTEIRFQMSEVGTSQSAEIVVYNVKGQIVKQLVSDQFSADQHSVIWNGDDESGKSISSGIYYYKLNVNGRTEAVRKCLLIK